MILSEDYIHQLLDNTKKQVSIPEDAGITLEGSIAEGFGNISSDIDFLVIIKNEKKRFRMPSIHFYDNRRIEYRFRTLTEITSEINTVLQLYDKKGKKFDLLNEDILDRVQRFSRGYILQNPDLIKPLQDMVDQNKFSKIISEWFKTRSQNAARYSIAMLELKQGSLARNWAQTALLEAAKSYVANQKELYISKKWIYHQLERAGISTHIRDEFRALLSNTNSLLDDNEYISKILEMIENFKVDNCNKNSNKIIVKRRKDVTAWKLGKNIHIVKGKQDIFKISAKADQIWHKITDNTELHKLLSLSNTDAMYTGSIIIKFQKLGFIDFYWNKGKQINVGEDNSLIIDAGLPIITFDGLYNKKNLDIQMSPLSAKKIAYSGLSLFWENTLVENICEDFTGAWKNKQWSLCENRIRELIRSACRIILSAYGVVPIPPLEDTVYYVNSLPHISKAIKASAMKFESIQIKNSSTAKAEFNKAKLFIKEIRDMVKIDSFPDSFESKEKWESTLDLGFDWIKLGGYVETDYHLEYIQDLINTIKNIFVKKSIHS